MVRATFEMGVDNKVEKKNVECKFFVGVGLSDIPELAHIPCIKGYSANCISMGGDVAVGEVVDTLAVSFMQIIDSFTDDPEKKKRLKMRFVEKSAQAALGMKDKCSATVVMGGH